jgi:hypothetical protein
VRQETLGEQFKNYAAGKYKTYAGTADLYVYFFEQGMNLLSDRGFFSFIVANKWMRANYGEPLRRWMKEHAIQEIIDFGDLQVFRNATTYPCIIRLSKKPEKEKALICKVKSLEFRDLAEYVETMGYGINVGSLKNEGWGLADEKSSELLKKIKSRGIPLREYVNGKIFYGIKTGLNDAFVIDDETRNRLIKEDGKSAEIIKPFLAGREIRRYQPVEPMQHFIFARRGISINAYPAIKSYLTGYKERLIPRPKSWKGSNWKGRKPGSYEWYEIQDSIDYFEEFEKPKIIYPNICKKPEFTFDESGKYTNQKCFIISIPDKYLLGILNSSLTFYLFREILPKLRGDFYEPSSVFFADFPIYNIALSDRNEKAQHDKLVTLVTSMLDLNKKRFSGRTNQEKAVLSRQIDATDKQIDNLVYEQYGLTAEEIAIVDGTAKAG